MTAKYTPHTGSRGISPNFEEPTAADVAEKILGSASMMDLLGLGGCAGYRLHSAKLGSARPDTQTLNQPVNSYRPKTLARTLTVQWQAMQTLPQERAGIDNPIEEHVIYLEGGTDDAPDTEWVWVSNGKGKLQATTV